MVDTDGNLLFKMQMQKRVGLSLKTAMICRVVDY
jgi:hypothetical protein